MSLLNPLAKLTAVGSAPATDGMFWTKRVVSKPTLASDAPNGSIIERDLAYIRSLSPGPMPWETSPREPVAKFQVEHVP